MKLELDPQIARDMVECLVGYDQCVTLLKQANHELSLQVQQQKQASLPSANLAQVQAMTDKMAVAGFIKDHEKEAAVDAVMRNPLALIPFLDKLAASRAQVARVPSLGHPVQEDAQPAGSAGQRASDIAYEQKFGQPR